MEVVGWSSASGLNRQHLPAMQQEAGIISATALHHVPPRTLRALPQTCSCLAAVVAKLLGAGASARAGPAGQVAASAGSCLMLADSRSRMMATSLLHTSSWWMR